MLNIKFQEDFDKIEKQIWVNIIKKFNKIR